MQMHARVKPYTKRCKYRLGKKPYAYKGEIIDVCSGRDKPYTDKG